MGIGDVAYTGLATYGRIQAIMGFIVALLVGGAFVGFGLWIALSKDVHTSTATGTVRDASCNSSSKTPECVMTVLFNDANGTPVIAKVTATDKFYVTGEKCEVRYDPNNPSDAEVGKAGKWLGWVFVAAGVAVILIAGLVLYFALKHKEVAAIGGGLSIVDDIIH